MAYLGNVKPTETTSSVLRSTYTGDGSTTTYNLPGPVANETSIIATINGVMQQDTAYSTNGSQIIFSGAPALGDSIELRTISGVGLSYAPSAGSVTTGILADGAVTSGKINDASVTGAKLGTGAAVANIGARAITAAQVPAGSVLQVVQSVYDTRDSTTSTSWVTMFNASITPTSSSSKILVMVSFSGSHTNNNSGLVRVLRNSTPIGGGEGGGSYEQNVGFNIRTSNDYYVATYAANHLDTPTTSSTITYNVQMQAIGGIAFYINRTISDSGTQSYDSSVASSITLMEIAG